VLHSLPIGYSLDDSTGIRDPRGMLGRRFGIDIHLMTSDLAVTRNLMLAIESCHLEVGAMAASSYAAGLSVLADDEADLGAALIDMGAGTTTMAVFSGGRFVYGDGFAVGGLHVTMDIARGLNTRIADAERIKTFYGSVLSGGSDERDMITIPPVDHDDRGAPQFVSRAQLVRIIKPRAEEILEMIRDRLAASPFAAEPRGRVVLTGGASQLTGLVDLAAQILGRPVRIGRPLGIARLPEEAKGPAFAAATASVIPRWPVTLRLKAWASSTIARSRAASTWVYTLMRSTPALTSAEYTAGNLDVARIGGRWLITNFVGSTSELTI
jgi:cell division protein FtsA